MARVIVRTILKRKGISVKEFARLLKRDHANVVRSTKPDANPRLSTLQEWAAVLKVRIRDLIRDGS